ncbi:MAG TPA: PQQ-binding-like beta-propeller repeat protein [Gaiellaceae bacterium]|nr:PQQ-binding-like beta-propeller repeat protein [Gaiellaceae bacterium]
MRRRILLSLAILGLLVAGAAVAVYLKARERPSGKLDTQLKGVSEGTADTRAITAPKQHKGHHLVDDKRCWREFGGSPQRTLSRPALDIGLPYRRFWSVGLGSYIEYPPSYCGGILYVNTFGGKTVALNSHNGHRLWQVQGGRKPSTPAIAGPRLIVSSHDGYVTAYNRFNGRRLWRLKVAGKVESSPVAVGRLVYFGATDGRLFCVYVRTGRVKWAYDTGGRINSSPSILGNSVFITTYAGSVWRLNRDDGHKIWSKYLSRDFVRYQSFYASASTDGKRLFTISRSGGVFALSTSNGDVVWRSSVNSWGYATPAVAHGRVFFGGFDGRVRALRASTGQVIWSRHLGGRFLGPAFVAGKYVFVSNLERNTYALRASDGKVMWHLDIGKYSPGIVTERHYFFTLNGIVQAWHGRKSPQILELKRRQLAAKHRVTATPKKRSP